MKSYYSKLDPKVVSDNNQFLKTVKPLFSIKIHGTPCIPLLEDNVVVSDDTKVAEILMNTLLIVLNFGIPIKRISQTWMASQKILCKRLLNAFDATLALQRLELLCATSNVFHFLKLLSKKCSTSSPQKYSNKKPI